MIELLQADGKTVAVAGNEFYVNAAEGADAKEADADVVIQVAVPAQTTESFTLQRLRLSFPKKTASLSSVPTRLQQRVFLQLTLT